MATRATPNTARYDARYGRASSCWIIGCTRTKVNCAYRPRRGKPCYTSSMTATWPDTGDRLRHWRCYRAASTGQAWPQQSMTSVENARSAHKPRHEPADRGRRCNPTCRQSSRSLTTRSISYLDCQRRDHCNMTVSWLRSTSSASMLRHYPCTRRRQRRLPQKPSTERSSAAEGRRFS